MNERKTRFPLAAIPFAMYFLIMLLRLDPIRGYLLDQFHYGSPMWYMIDEMLDDGIIFNNFNVWTVACAALALFICLLSVMKQRGLLLAGILLLHTAYNTVAALAIESTKLNVCKVLGYLFSAFASAALAVMVIINCDMFSTKANFSRIKAKINKIWFLPGLFSLIGTLIFPTNTILYHMATDSFFGRSVLPEIVLAVAWLMLAFWLRNPWKKEKPVVGVSSDYIDGYCSMGKHIVLSLFTFGVWPCIWTYRTTQVLNKAPGVEYYNPVTKLLLCIFVPFYQIYWYYKHGQRIDAYARQKKLNASDMATLCLILGIFIPIVANIVMQDRINAICTAKDVAIESTIKPETPQSNADELKKYKELLDGGIITQEEFDAKKKQLLGL